MENHIIFQCAFTKSSSSPNTQISNEFERSIKIYGAAEQRAQLEPLLRWATPHQRGFPPPRPDGSRDIPGLADIPHTQLYNEYMISQSESGPLTSEEQRKLQATAESLARAEELRIMLANLERRDDESRRGSLLDKLCSTEDILQLPEHPNPPGVSTGELVVNLLKHQVCVSSCKHLQWLKGTFRSLRNKLYNGVSIASILNCPLGRKISLFSFGS